MFSVQVVADKRELRFLERIAEAGERIADAAEKLVHPTSITRTVTYRLAGRTFQAKGDSIMLQAKATEVPGTATGTYAFEDAEGNQVTPDGNPSYSVDNADVVDSVETQADGSVKVHLTNTVGVAQLSIVASFGGVEKTFADVIQIVPGDVDKAVGTFSAVTPDA